MQKMWVARTGDKQLRQTTLTANRIQKEDIASNILKAKGETRCIPGGMITSPLSDEGQTCSSEFGMDLDKSTVINKQVISTSTMKETGGGTEPTLGKEHDQATHRENGAGDGRLLEQRNEAGKQSSRCSTGSSSRTAVTCSKDVKGRSSQLVA